MNVLDILLSSQKGGQRDALTSMSGLQQYQMQQLLNQVLPVLAGGLKNGMSSQSDLEGLIDALTSVYYDRCYDQSNSH